MKASSKGGLGGWVVSGKGGRGGGDGQCQCSGGWWARLGLCWGCSGLGKGKLCGEEGWQEHRIARMHPAVVSQAAGSVISAVRSVCTFPGWSWVSGSSSSTHWDIWAVISLAHSSSACPGAPGQCPLCAVKYLSKLRGCEVAVGVGGLSESCWWRATCIN